MKRLLKTSLIMAAMIPAMAMAVPSAGDREITLSGAGASDKDFDQNGISMQGSWGEYLSPSSLWGVRQSIGISDSEGEETNFDGSTRVFYDYHFGTGDTRPFIGASIGGIYGEQVDESFIAGPEIGVKHWVKEDVFITGMMEYQFLFKSASDADDRYDDGAIFYSVGVGYNF
ncbi:hypothetical protein [Halopseudomonas salina]|uniref:Outer membrane protein beta-barrel domain-containing protein n=1 Tax=Halopseudomonas salina TaxID=1323744 RepID=A0ABQ1NX55_9GAMM|nr:hypothetical protein [Halopseudomonas salina]GGC85858.1 hypothetical protein GCM10007418_02020 [Halopseudomonas salina]